MYLKPQNRTFISIGLFKIPKLPLEIMLLKIAIVALPGSLTRSHLVQAWPTENLLTQQRAGVACMKR
jgi:hypothetical protein